MKITRKLTKAVERFNNAANTLTPLVNAEIDKRNTVGDLLDLLRVLPPDFTDELRLKIRRTMRLTTKKKDEEKWVPFDVHIPNTTGDGVVEVIQIQIPVIIDPITKTELLTGDAMALIDKTKRDGIARHENQARQQDHL